MCEDTIYFYHEGGVDVGDPTEKADKLHVQTGQTITEDSIMSLMGKVSCAPVEFWPFC